MVSKDLSLSNQYIDVDTCVVPISSHQSKRVGKVDQHFHPSLCPRPGSWMQRRRKDLSFSCSRSCIRKWRPCHVHWPFRISAVILRNDSCQRVFYRFPPAVLVQSWRSYSYFFIAGLIFEMLLSLTIISVHMRYAWKKSCQNVLHKCLALILSWTVSSLPYMWDTLFKTKL